MKLPEPPTLRPLNRDDEQELNLVYAGWMRTYGRSFDARHGLETPVLFRMLTPVIRRLVEASTITVACDHDAVLGWVAIEGELLHYVCVKSRWQRLGVATHLLEGFVPRAMRYSHMTADGLRLRTSLAPKDWTYSPMERFETKEMAA